MGRRAGRVDKRFGAYGFPESRHVSVFRCYMEGMLVTLSEIAGNEGRPHELPGRPPLDQPTYDKVALFCFCVSVARGIVCGWFLSSTNPQLHLSEQVAARTFFLLNLFRPGKSREGGRKRERERERGKWSVEGGEIVCVYLVVNHAVPEMMPELLLNCQEREKPRGGVWETLRGPTYVDSAILLWATSAAGPEMGVRSQALARQVQSERGIPSKITRFVGCGRRYKVRQPHTFSMMMTIPFQTICD